LNLPVQQARPSASINATDSSACDEEKDQNIKLGMILDKQERVFMDFGHVTDVPDAADVTEGAELCPGNALGG
jgi:hypothetical protein